MAAAKYSAISLLLVCGFWVFGVESKCSLTALEKESTVAYACVNSNFNDLEEVPSDAEWIEFTVSRIADLPPDAFSRFKDLRRLTFYNCDLKRRSSEAFRGLENLEWLVMSNTRMEIVRADDFRHLTNLKRLTLDGAGIVYIEPEVFRGFSNLETLSLRDNDLDCLPLNAMTALGRLKTAQIGKNPWLCDCRIAIGRFFQERGIEYGPDETCAVGTINGTMRFRTDDYECMTILEYPDLPSTEYPGQVSGYHGRFEWRLTSATGISSMDRLPDEISWIQLFDVPISTVGRYAFFRFGNTLRSIELTNCGIERIEREAFAGLHKLERLSLTRNRFTVLGSDWFRDLVRLNDLVLRDNEIETIEENALAHLVNLKRLDVRGNRLRCLNQNHIRGLISLQRIEAADNPWLCECKNDLEAYLLATRIGYGTSSGRCELPGQNNAVESPPYRQRFWNSSTSGGKIRWSWAHEVHRPGVPTPIHPTYRPRIIVSTTPHPPPPTPRLGGCHLVPGDSQGIKSCLCTRASLVDLEDMPDTLETIVFSGSVIPTLHNDAFRKFGRFLRRLEFRDCGIQNIERRALYGLRMLETLVIRGNDLDFIKAEWFEDTHNLRRLDLANNGITRISNGAFDRFPYLIALDITGNRLNCVGIEHIDSLRYLRELQISGNPWTCLCITRLVQLMKERHIDCKCNPETLLKFNEGGWGCQGDQKYPTIGSVPPPVPTTEPPRTVQPAPTTELPTMPTEWQSRGTCYTSSEGGSTVTWYHCANGDITLLRKIPSYITKIEIIDSYVPHLSAMAFARFENLTELILRNCTLRDVDTHAFVGLGRLEKLTIRENRFSVVKNGWFADTRNLVRLDMSDNYLNEIETGAFEHLEKLEYLNLEGNAFQCIYTSCFVTLPSLATLEFGRNPLKWRCWQEIRQFLEIRAIGYTYYKCPHDGRDLVRNILKNDRPAGQTAGSSFCHGNYAVSVLSTLLAVGMAEICRF